MHLATITGENLSDGCLTEQTYFLATVTGFSLKKYPPAEVSHLKRADTATDAANDGRLCFSSQTERNRRKETNEVAQKPKDPWSTTDTLSAKVRAVLFSPHTSPSATIAENTVQTTH